MLIPGRVANATAPLRSMGARNATAPVAAGVSVGELAGGNATVPRGVCEPGAVGCRQVTQNFKGSFSAVSKPIPAIKMCCSAFFEIFKVGSLLYRSQLNMHSFLLPFRKHSMKFQDQILRKKPH